MSSCWILITYLVGAGITFLSVYAFFAKKYVKEKSALKFSYWIDQYLGNIICFTIFWPGVLPIIAALGPIIIGVKLIDKHYGIK